MVKKNYVAPATNESRTKLRATILAGSGGTGIGTNPTGGEGNGTITGGTGSGEPGTQGDTFAPARQRSASSLD